MQIDATYNASALLLNKCGSTVTIVYSFYYQLTIWISYNCTNARITWLHIIKKLCKKIIWQCYIHGDINQRMGEADIHSGELSCIFKSRSSSVESLFEIETILRHKPAWKLTRKLNSFLKQCCLPHLLCIKLRIT